jgi:methylthioribose-1-phosphate isomerase
VRTCRSRSVSAREVTHVRGRMADGSCAEVEVVAPGSPVRNPGFDVTPARLVTGIITERGVAAASRAGLAVLFPRHASQQEGPHA